MENPIKKNKSTLARTLLALLAVVVLALGAFAFTLNGARAQETDPPETVSHAPAFGVFPGFGRPGKFGGGPDYDAFLAKALSITVEELHTAQEAAHAMTLEEAVAQGYLAEEQADLIKARQALAKYIDREAVLASALGISVDELQAALQAGKSPLALMKELGLDAEQVHAGMQAAFEAALKQAVQDGVITQQQADQMSEAGFGGRMFAPGKRGFGGGFPGDGCFPVPPDSSGQDGGI